MGISGLLPQLKSITKKAHISKYRGKRIAVDAYCLLHRGAYSCSRELVEGIPTDRCTQYCMGRIELLIQNGVIPYVVFDGGPLPNKSEEEQARHRSRSEHKARARTLWQQGNKTAALECYQRAVDITPAVAKGFIDALKRRGVQFIVAPYEADAQMAYLALTGAVDVVLTEDSDLLAYGCPHVFFKMDKGGQGEEIVLADLPLCKELNFTGWTHDLFVEMCVMAGCDFAKAPPGIGIKKAHAHLRRCRSFVRAIKAIKFDGVAVPPDHDRKVQRAIWTFRYQRVYCPETRTMRHLREPSGGDITVGAAVPGAARLNEGEVDFLGPWLPNEIATAIAVGDINPMTHQPFKPMGLGGSLAMGGRVEQTLAAGGHMPLLQQEEEEYSEEEEEGDLDDPNNDEQYIEQHIRHEMHPADPGMGPPQKPLHGSTAHTRLGFKRPRPAGSTASAADMRRQGIVNPSRAVTAAPGPGTSGLGPGSLRSMLRAAMSDTWNVQRNGPEQQRDHKSRPTNEVNLRRQQCTEEDLGLSESPDIEEELGLKTRGNIAQENDDEEDGAGLGSWQWNPKSAAASPTDSGEYAPPLRFNETPWKLFQEGRGQQGPRHGHAITPDFYAGLTSTSPSRGKGISPFVRDDIEEGQLEALRASLHPLARVHAHPGGHEDQLDYCDGQGQGHHEDVPPNEQLPPPASENPIADLSHIPACVRVAEVAVANLVGRAMERGAGIMAKGARPGVQAPPSGAKAKTTMAAKLKGRSHGRGKSTGQKDIGGYHTTGAAAGGVDVEPEANTSAMFAQFAFKK